MSIFNHSQGQAISTKVIKGLKSAKSLDVVVVDKSITTLSIQNIPCKDALV